MRSYILSFLLFLFFFPIHVIGFKYSSDVSCAFINSQVNNEIIYTYTWVIKDFQDFCNKDYSGGIFSEKFYSPILDNQEENHAWRISLYPRFSYNRREYISIYLVAFQTNYEKLNGLKNRQTRTKFEVYVSDSKIESMTRESLKLLTQSEIESHTFLFDNKNIIPLDYYEFCEISNIFPNGDTSAKTNLVIRSHFYKNENSTESMPDYDFNSNSQDYFKQFEEFEHFFNNNVFSDITFKFSCGSEIKASKMFLAFKSVHFKKLFEQIDKEDSKALIFHIEGVSYNCFYKLLYFVYTGRIDNNLSYNELVELYNESNWREINDLKEIISCKIIKFVNENTWDEILLLGWKTKNNVLKNSAMKFLSDNWTKVKDTDKMRNLETAAKIEWLEELFIAKLFGV
ncbi:hypothetical protein RclHR1_01960032 [Rhizophagus clarus]|uniref:Speckle-type POZ protein B-like n=1 Tax=Rhizophagus clarus TaxID=94130 RepID=A0A2Z6QUD3_9GLOM|nr:hypothetical protein RclHR1_01960032 [Rhizophagus clarus]GES78517.1 speckle-type POZ protein B-like [Rhizophagus clarus]